jgi:hypothetical protein
MRSHIVGDCKPSHDGNRRMIALTWPLGTVVSVATSLAANLYQGIQGLNVLVDSQTRLNV